MIQGRKNKTIMSTIEKMWVVSGEVTVMNAEYKNEGKMSDLKSNRYHWIISK